MAAYTIKDGWEEPGEVEFSSYTERGEGSVFETWYSPNGIAGFPILETLRERADEVLQCASAKVLYVVFQAKAQYAFDNEKLST